MRTSTTTDSEASSVPGSGRRRDRPMNWLERLFRSRSSRSRHPSQIKFTLERKRSDALFECDGDITSYCNLEGSCTDVPAYKDELATSLDGIHPLDGAHSTSCGSLISSCACNIRDDVSAALNSLELRPRQLTIAFLVGIGCGIVAVLYRWVMNGLLQYVWHDLGPMLAPADYEWVWIPIVCVVFGGITGLLIHLLGAPLENLSGTVLAFHRDGRLPYDDAHAMAAISISGIVAGGSLGPEAPLVAIGGGVASGFAELFQMSNSDTHTVTISGMAAGLVAFLGAPLGGSLFACEVIHRWGIEYYEALLPSLVAGLVCNWTFRSLMNEPQNTIWTFAPEPEIPPWTTVQGIGFGLISGVLGFIWIHTCIFIRKGIIGGLGGETWHVAKGLVGGAVIGGVGLLLPETLFWAEHEAQTIIDLGETELPHVWPTVGPLGQTPLDSGSWMLLISAAKLFVIAVTVAIGYRGGFIFPFMFAGHALGTGLSIFFPWMSPAAAALSCASAINASVTRTWLSSPITVCTLSGRIDCLPMTLVASIVSLFAVGDASIIKAAQPRKPIVNEPKQPQKQVVSV